MNDRAELWLDSVLSRSHVQRFFVRRAAERLAILAYHGIDDADRFSQHMAVIRRTASPVTLGEVLDGFEGRRSLPAKAVLITFDDGHRSVLEVGLPILRDLGLPAVAFVISGVLDSEQPFWWDEVKDLAGRGGVAYGMQGLLPADLVRALKRVPDERRRLAIDQLRVTAGPAQPVPQLTTGDLLTLEASGIAIGNHTVSHPCLSRCSEESRRREIEDSHAALTVMLGHEPDAFAYPDGQQDAFSAGILRRLGYRAGFLFDHRLSVLRPPNHLSVSRLRVNASTTLDRFQTITSGLHPAIHRVRTGG